MDTEETLDTGNTDASTDTVAEPEGGAPADPQDVTPVDRPQQTQRQTRKQQRIDVEAANRDRDEWRRKFEEHEARNAARDREFAELRGKLAERDAREQRQDQNAETKGKIADLRRQARTKLFFASKAQTVEENNKYWDEADALNDEANKLLRRIEDEPEWNNRQSAMMSQMPDQRVQQAVAGLDIMFPWVRENDEARSMADTRLNYLTGNPQHGGAGKPFTRETVLEAMTWTAKVLNLGGHAAPTNGQKARYGGVPAGEGPGGGGNGGPSVPWDRDTEALALAAYRHLEPKEAKKQWLKDMSEWQASNRQG